MTIKVINSANCSIITMTYSLLIKLTLDSNKLLRFVKKRTERKTAAKTKHGAIFSAIRVFNRRNYKLIQRGRYNRKHCYGKRANQTFLRGKRRAKNRKEARGRNRKLGKHIFSFTSRGTILRSTKSCM